MEISNNTKTNYGRGNEIKKPKSPFENESVEASLLESWNDEYKHEIVHLNVEKRPP